VYSLFCCLSLSRCIPLTNLFSVAQENPPFVHLRRRKKTAIIFFHSLVWTNQAFHGVLLFLCSRRLWRRRCYGNLVIWFGPTSRGIPCGHAWSRITLRRKYSQRCTVCSLDFLFFPCGLRCNMEYVCVTTRRGCICSWVLTQSRSLLEEVSYFS